MFFHNTIIGKFCAMISPKSLEMANEKIIYDTSKLQYFHENNAEYTYDTMKNFMLSVKSNLDIYIS